MIQSNVKIDGRTFIVVRTETGAPFCIRERKRRRGKLGVFSYWYAKHHKGNVPGSIVNRILEVS